MQAIHSLTVGVDPTLEEATRLALDQTANFTLFDALQFFGSRGVSPFEHHDHYQLLGQGTVRAGIAGRGGRVEDSAYLLVHAHPSDAGNHHRHPGEQADPPSSQNRGVTVAYR